MLVLSRQKYEDIIITLPPSTAEQRVNISVVEIRGDKVRIGVEADRSVSVHRAEVQRAIDRETAREGA